MNGVDDPEDLGTDASSVVGRWIAEIEQAEKGRKDWLARCKKIIRLYKSQEKQPSSKRKFAMLWANVSVLQPAIYARVPQAVCSRRWKDADPVGRNASEALERAINFTFDAFDLDSVLKACRNELLLCGLGQAWVRYVPQIVTDGPPPPPGAEDAEALDVKQQAQVGEVADGPAEHVAWEEVFIDHVAYDDFLHNAARTWQEVRWVSRQVFLTREECKARFTKASHVDGKTVGEMMPLDWKVVDDADPAKAEYLNKARVYELWDKASRTAYWISKGYTADVLDEREDPLKLRDFFPCPKPILATTAPDSLIPTPDYIYYQDQAEEVDDLTQRIGKLTDSLKVVGVYAGEHKDTLANLLKQTDGTLIPVDTYAALSDKGGVKGIVDWFPVEMVANVLKALVEQRKELIDDVYQLTGISDIMRGDTDPNETKGAQVIKSNWGSSRVRDRQQEVARFAKDITRMVGEVIASTFDQPTLAKMSDLQLLTKVQQQQMAMQFQAATQQAQQAQQPPPPGPPQLQQPTWDDVFGLLRDKALRSFRIDIETDSTIEPNEQQEKASRIEFVGAIGKLIAESVPLVQGVPAMAPLVAESVKFIARSYRVGRDMEDAIDQAFDALEHMPPQQPQAKGAPPPDPQVEQMKAQAAQTTAQANMLKAQADQGHLQVEGAKVSSAHQIGMAQVAAENNRTAADVHLGHVDVVAQAAQKAQERTLQQRMMPGPLVQPHGGHA